MPTASPIAGQERLFNTVFETRTLMSFHVRETALAPFMPPGWRVAPSAAGPTRGANFRFGLSEQLAAIDADGNPVGTQRFCPLTVDAIREGMPRSQRMAIGGWSTTADRAKFRLPDASGAGPAPKTPDLVEIERSARVALSGESTLTERWLFRSARPAPHAAAGLPPARTLADMAGEALAVELGWTRGELSHGRDDFRIYSPASGDFYRQYRVEKVEEIVFSAPLAINRTSRLSYQATGPVLSHLFDGSETLVSIAVLAFGRREIYLS